MPALKHLLLVVIIGTLMAACSSAEKDAYRSQAKVNERKIEISKEYEKCINKSSDEAGREKCEAILKAGEAL